MGGAKAAAKSGYFDKLKGLLQEYKSIFVVQVDNVSSQQMHEIRQSLRGEGIVLMGKNTMVCMHTHGDELGRTQGDQWMLMGTFLRSAVPSRPS